MQELRQVEIHVQPKLAVLKVHSCQCPYSCQCDDVGLCRESVRASTIPHATTTTPDNIRPGRDLLMTLYGTGSLTHPETRGQGTKTIKLCNADRSSKTKTMMSTYHRWLETLPLPECATATRLKRNKTACMATSKACHHHAVATGAYLYSLKIAVKSAGREH